MDGPISATLLNVSTIITKIRDIRNNPARYQEVSAQCGGAALKGQKSVQPGLKGESSLIQPSVPYLTVRGYINHVTGFLHNRQLEWTIYFRPMPREYPGVLWKNSA